MTPTGHSAHGAPSAPIRGVRPADQKRSRVLQDKFVSAGRDVLQHTRLNDISVPDLARAASSSVGGFYSRFETKSAFFDFLRMRMLQEHMAIYDRDLSPESLRNTGRFAISEATVDVMLSIFSGPWRGVLREAYATISERPDTWEPMNKRGQFVRARITELYKPHFAEDPGLEQRISIAVQLLFSALNNEMMNPHLAFRIDHPAFRGTLIHSFDTTIAGRFAAPDEDTQT